MISNNAKSLLERVLADSSKQIFNSHKNLDGTKYIAIGGKSVSDGTFEDYAVWLAALEELNMNGLVQNVNAYTVFSVTAKGAMYK